MSGEPAFFLLCVTILFLLFVQRFLIKISPSTPRRNRRGIKKCEKIEVNGKMKKVKTENSLILKKKLSGCRNDWTVVGRVEEGFFGLAWTRPTL